MLNTTSIETVNASTFSQSFVKPLYDSYCFANIPATIAALLTGAGQGTLPADVFGTFPTCYEKVVFLFIDAFGWCFFERYAEQYEFLKTVVNQGVVSKLTSQFPSTTAAHVTCIHTGLPVGQSGIYEWVYYDPQVDALITPLLFSYARDGLKRDTLKAAAIAPASLYPTQTFYQTLKAQGINSHIFQFQGYTPSTYSDVVFQGGRVHPYASIQEALVYLSELLAVKTAAPTYYFLYFDRIDSLCHQHGPQSQQFDEAVRLFLAMMQELFYNNCRGKTEITGKTALLMSADHGQVAVDPQTTYYLDRAIPGFEYYIQTNRQGQFLVPAGSARDLFLYIKEELVDEAIAVLQRHLVGRAEVYPTQELLEQGYFGTQKPSPTLLHRLGNVVVLPYEGETVWWTNNGKPAMQFRGHHGGLTRAEMEIPLLFLPL